MDTGDQGKEFCEKFEKLASESEPDGYKAFKKTLSDLMGRKSKARKSKSKEHEQSQKDEDTRALTSDQQPQREPEVREISEDDWVYPQSSADPTGKYPHSSSPPRDPASSLTSEDDRYRFRHQKRGYAVLIINSEFDSQSKRGNAGWDKYYMYKMFNELNFDVCVLENLTSYELLREMKAIQRRIVLECDCFACVISSHGMEGQARIFTPGFREPFIRTEHFTYTRDGVVRTSELLELFNDRNCRNLRGKPKMFFIQACRSRLDVQRPDEVDMGVEVHVVRPTDTDRSTGDTASFFSRGDRASKDDTNQTKSDGVPANPQTKDIVVPTTGSETANEKATTESETADKVTSTGSETTGDVAGNYDDYSGRRGDEYRRNFTAASLDPVYTNCQIRGLSRQNPYHHHGYHHQGYRQQENHQQEYHQQEQRGYQVNVQASLHREVPPGRTPTYKYRPAEELEPEVKSEPEAEPVEVFQIPCYNDYLVMFSSAAGTIAWSDSGKGGWLMYCLYHVFRDVTYTERDLLTTLTGVCGKMALEMETFCPSTPHYDRAKSAACVYHRLSKDIYLQPVS